MGPSAYNSVIDEEKLVGEDDKAQKKALKELAEQVLVTPGLMKHLYEHFVDNASQSNLYEAHLKPREELAFNSGVLSVVRHLETLREAAKEA